MVRHCARGRPPLPSPSPTLRTAARDTGPQRRGLFSGAARTLPGSSRRANDILYIRVRRREGENVLHRAAGNDVDNFSVDNPLWITAAAGGRLLRGGSGRLCGGSVNADGGSVNAGAEVQTRTGRVRKSFAGDGCSQGASFDPMAAISRRGQAGRIYNNTRARVLLRRMCVKPADLTTHSPPKASSRPRTATRPPKHFCSPTQRRRTPAGCAMHAPPTAQPFPRSATLPPLPFRFGHKKTAPHSACAMPNVSVDRRCGRSFGLVSRALFAAVAGRWRVGVGLRPQPWALRSRRCGRVLRA